MNFKRISLKQEIIINKIISIHYFEYMSNFSFEGESHDFWEFLCVDKGTVNVDADAVTHTLNKGEIIFHKPNEFHNVYANGIIAPNLVVIGFECNSPAMSFFKDKILKIGAPERALLGSIIKEAGETYANRLDDPYMNELTRKSSPYVPFASEQLIKLYLEQLLIQLERTNVDTPSLHVTTAALPKSTRQKGEDEMFGRILTYMEEHLSSQLTIEQICRDNLIGRSVLQKLFREHTDSGVIDYFSGLKIDVAKQMIRSQKMNFTQVADSLGYTSIHYFSRQFKKLTGMTPSEYASSIKLLSESRK